MSERPIHVILRDERVRRGYNQHTLAKMLDTSQSHLSELERGIDVRLSTLRRWARLLDLDVRLVKEMGK